MGTLFNPALWGIWPLMAIETRSACSMKSNVAAVSRVWVGGAPALIEVSGRGMCRVSCFREGAALSILKRACGISHQYGGEEHSGWLPPGAATPLPTPVRHVTLDVTIEAEGPGFLLIFAARQEPGFGGDWWFDDLAAAEATAEEWFGIGAGRWETA